MKFKTMLNKERIMFIVIQKIIVILYLEFFVGGYGISQECRVPMVTYVEQNHYLEGMLVHFLHLIKAL